jgi:hypothetical protein
MEIQDAKGLPAKQLLLFPMNMLHQFFTALLPGVLALFLLMMKHSSLIPAALSATSMLGYKTRIGLALLVAFVVGRVFQSALLVCTKLLRWLPARFKKANATPTPPEVLQPESASREHPANASEAPTKPTGQPVELTPEQLKARHFFGGLLMGTVVAQESTTFDYWEAHRAHLGFFLNSGLVLLVASFYPGDGLRIYELAGGVLLLFMGLVQAVELSKVRSESLGKAVGQLIASHSVEENVKILQFASILLPIITKHINPAAGELEPVKIVKEIAEKVKSAPESTQNWQLGNKKKSR